jgi:hypothetical protein
MDDLSSLLGDFYTETSNNSLEYQIGQIVYSPVLEVTNRCWIGDVKRVDSYAHDKVEMHIRKQTDEDFKQKDRLPIKALSLDAFHELVLTRAKCRPCVIIGRSDKFDISKLPVGVEKNKALNAVLQQFILAPLYSISTPEKTTAFGATITARIKCLMYPQFFYMPKHGVAVKKDSILRLDHIFVNPLVAGVNSTTSVVKEKILAFIHEQLKMLTGKVPTENFIQSRELLLECLPNEYK